MERDHVKAPAVQPKVGSLAQAGLDSGLPELPVTSGQALVPPPRFPFGSGPAKEATRGNPTPLPPISSQLAQQAAGNHREALRLASKAQDKPWKGWALEALVASFKARDACDNLLAGFAPELIGQAMEANILASSAHWEAAKVGNVARPMRLASAHPHAMLSFNHSGAASILGGLLGLDLTAEGSAGVAIGGRAYALNDELLWTELRTTPQPSLLEEAQVLAEAMGAWALNPFSDGVTSGIGTRRCSISTGTIWTTRARGSSRMFMMPRYGRGGAWRGCTERWRFKPSDRAPIRFIRRERDDEYGHRRASIPPQGSPQHLAYSP